MSGVHRCPHCKAELPEKAAFCANCGRRIEGWSVPKDATPPMGQSAGEAALPSPEAPTRQMDVTPSLLRAAAVSVRKRRRGAPIVAMIVVAAAGAIAAFFVVRANVRKKIVPASVPVVAAPAPSAPSAPAVAPTPTPTKTPTVGGRKHAHVVSGAQIINVKAKKVKAVKVAAGGGLPHKSVDTDSKSVAQQESQSQKAMALPTVEHETSESAPPTEAEQKQEAEARLDADSVRFVVKAHLPQVRACYGRAFKDSSPGGTVEIGFAIDAGGRAQNVRTETNTTDSESLAHCLEERVKQWQFPKPLGGDYELIYPFVFAPGS